jgi:hypothetical protein
LPILEVNAGYPNSVADISNLEQEFLARGKPGILILPNNPNLELAANNAQFQAISSLVLLEVQAEINEIIVEQVSWTQAETLARVWCMFYQALDWQDFIAKEIARALQQHPSLSAYLAFENHQVVGMMIALETGFSGWLAGETRVLEAFANRLASDFENTLLSASLEQSKDFANTRMTDTYSVWVKI